MAVSRGSSLRKSSAACRTRQRLDSDHQAIVPPSPPETGTLPEPSRQIPPSLPIGVPMLTLVGAGDVPLQGLCRVGSDWESLLGTLRRIYGSPPPRVTFRRVAVPLRGLDGHPFVPPHVASGRCVLSAAAAGAPAGVVAAFAAPSRWCTGAVHRNRNDPSRARCSPGCAHSGQRVSGRATDRPCCRTMASEVA